jgi:hypothetical protein
VNEPQVAGNRNEDAPAFVGVAPRGDLPDSRLQHLIGMEASIFAQQRKPLPVVPFASSSTISFSSSPARPLRHLLSDSLSNGRYGYQVV